MSKCLVIGDPHCIADDPHMERFDILGAVIADEQPDCVVQIGDFLTYDSVSAHNLGKRLTMEGQRLHRELGSGKEAYDRIMQPIFDLNSSRRSNRKALYRPDMFWLEGNHEDRAYRYVDQNPEMQGVVEYTSKFNPEDDGWVLVPYREHAYYGGVLFTHAPMSGNNQPISSKHIIKNVIKDYDCPLVFGHTHKLGYESDGVLSREGGIRRTALNCGCYFDHLPEYAAGSRGIRDWWAGVVFLDNMDGSGDFDLRTISLNRLREMYL